MWFLTRPFDLIPLGANEKTAQTECKHGVIALNDLGGIRNRLNFRGPTRTEVSPRARHR